jgi:predicted DNA-binding transcriptional regulator YafY
MPVGKQPHRRYKIIDECLSNKHVRYYSSDQLLRKLADKDMPIQLRCLKADLEAMRIDEGAPIAYCRTNKGYYYTDPDFSIRAVALNDEDFRALQFATDILQQYMGVSMVKQFEGAIDKVVKVVKQLKTDAETKSRVIAFEKAPYYKGLEYFERIHTAITDQQPLKITYRKFFSDKGNIHTFHPYSMKEYKDRWYVIGYGKERHFTFPLGLDRIESIEGATVPYRPNKTIDLDKYFEHTLGITIAKGPVQDVRLWFSPAQAPYIKTRHIHNSLKIVSDAEDGLVVSLALIPNYELMQEILSYGPEVKVLGPESLRDSIKEMLKKAGSLYE